MDDPFVCLFFLVLRFSVYLAMRSRSLSPPEFVVINLH